MKGGPPNLIRGFHRVLSFRVDAAKVFDVGSIHFPLGLLSSI
jgi:hypothetical protein